MAPPSKGILANPFSLTSANGATVLREGTIMSSTQVRKRLGKLAQEVERACGLVGHTLLAVCEVRMGHFF